MMQVKCGHKVRNQQVLVDIHSFIRSTTIEHLLTICARPWLRSLMDKGDVTLLPWNLQSNGETDID